MPDDGVGTDESQVSSAIVTIPNIISFIRLLLIPLFLWLIFAKDEIALAGWLLGVIGSTDWIDGYLARRLNQVTELGKALDPIADRLAVVAAVIAGMMVDVIPIWFGVALMVREIVMAINAAVLLQQTGQKLAVRQMGKLATLLLYLAIAWWYVGIGTPFVPLEVGAWVVGIPGLILYYVVAVQYLQETRQTLADGRRR